MQLKLAEYNRNTGAFLGFIPLGQKFMYAGDFIVVETGGWEHKDLISEHPNKTQKLFNGLFSGRTYGGGRFVLIKIGKTTEPKEIKQDDIILDEHGLYNMIEWANTVPRLLIKRKAILDRCGANIVGNIHENPELWEDVK